MRLGSSVVCIVKAGLFTMYYIFWQYLPGKIKCGALGNSSTKLLHLESQNKKGSGLEQIMDGDSEANDDGGWDFLSLS